jgi:hypothetical protein
MRRRRYGYGEAFVVVMWPIFTIAYAGIERDMFPSGTVPYTYSTTVHHVGIDTQQLLGSYIILLMAHCSSKSRYARSPHRWLHRRSHNHLLIVEDVSCIPAGPPVTERPKKCRCPASEGGSVWRIVSRQHACSPSWLPRWGARSRKHGGIPSTSRQPSVRHHVFDQQLDGNRRADGTLTLDFRSRPAFTL